MGLSKPESCVCVSEIFIVCCSCLVLKTVHIRYQPTREMASGGSVWFTQRKSFRVNMVVYIVHMSTFFEHVQSFFTRFTFFNISFIFSCASVGCIVSKNCGVLGTTVQTPNITPSIVFVSFVWNRSAVFSHFLGQIPNTNWKLEFSLLLLLVKQFCKKFA